MTTGKIIVLAHDPENGCGACPMGYWPFPAPSQAVCCSALRLPNYKKLGLDGHTITGDGLLPAPEECPLRSGSVILRNKELPK